MKLSKNKHIYKNNLTVTIMARRKAAKESAQAPFRFLAADLVLKIPSCWVIESERNGEMRRQAFA